MRLKIALSFGFSLSIYSLCFCQISPPYGELLFEDTLTFDPQYEWISIPSAENNIWQIGYANKDFLDGSSKKRAVIITDTINNYPTMVDDYFLLSIPTKNNFYSWAEGILSFYHKYQTDSLYDGGMIEISYDGGESWRNVLYDHAFLSFVSTGLYSESDTIIGCLPAFTGTSYEWKYTELHWVWYGLVKKTTGEINGLPALRFRFISDSIDTGKDGWLIDNVVFRGYDVSGSFENRIPEAVKVFPNPISNFLSIEAANYIENVIFKLYGFDGKLLSIIPVNDHQKVDVTNLSQGIYFFTIEKDNVIINSGRIIKN
jgi:hypothetical protein